MDNSPWHGKRLLLVDDEPELLAFVSDILTDAGFTHVFVASNVADALDRFGEVRPDLLVLDVMLPDGDGFSLMRKVRKTSDVPVIFLTAKDEPIDRVSGLGLGADDYIPKPFLPQELLLRVYAVLRRTYPAGAARVRLDFCVIDFDKAEVVRDDGPVALTAKEYALLEVLARNQGNVVTTDVICEALWGGNAFGYENPLNAHVRRVREKIERDPSHPVSLVTFKGLGYKLNTCG
ncbi:response regulator transcription factor [Olsenella sp. HMSC062G07]|uniref:response regulator transcription factor n=1 Tax=Olsenella sp. HMSC062G07 TaxID=1739330 RepID=UPI0008A44BC7|nr:response regulator transcription factor [Olsenella sp. HMSC062G07]OFK22809.1 DNA-binding response regulator [Olsenella sp. HMSC062G07]